LYDISARKVLHEIAASEVKQVYWNNGFTHIAIVTKTCKFLRLLILLEIIIANKNLEIINA
jgi:hypothetical protein